MPLPGPPESPSVLNSQRLHAMRSSPVGNNLSTSTNIIKKLSLQAAYDRFTVTAITRPLTPPTLSKLFVSTENVLSGETKPLIVPAVGLMIVSLPSAVRL